MASMARLRLACNYRTWTACSTVSVCATNSGLAGDDECCCPGNDHDDNPIPSGLSNSQRNFWNHEIDCFKALTYGRA